jgi:hypothetical protein
VTDVSANVGAGPSTDIAEWTVALQRELDAVRRTLEDQTLAMDALRARAESASAHETELRALLLDAHEQLLQRDLVIADLRGTGLGKPGGANNLLEERTRWAQRAVADVAQRDEVIRQLQASLEEQTAWAQRSAAEVAHRDAIIRQLQASARWSGAAVARLTLLRRLLPGRVQALFGQRLHR